MSVTEGEEGLEAERGLAELQRKFWWSKTWVGWDDEREICSSLIK